MKFQSNNYPSLNRSFKNLFPFKIGTTSFIYPDLYVPNVKMLGPFVDEIELLLFESEPFSSLFSKTVLEDLQRLSEELKLTYNIHLPTDISISDPNPARQKQAIQTLIKIAERVAPLSPATYTLHVPYAAAGFDGDHIGKWQEAVYGNLEEIVASGVPANQIAIETLDYPLQMIARIVTDLELSICMDIGHLVLQGANLPFIFDTFYKSISIIHLHGIENGKDHRPLDRLPKNLLDPVLKILNRFSGTVSLEVFGFEHLQASLNFLGQHWNPDPMHAGITANPSVDQFS
jgi:sugar phosphate isomerase/epimerase